MVGDAAESPKEKQAREKREKAEKLKEYGGRCSTWALFSMATPFEFLVLCVGVLGAVCNGVNQQLINVFFGDSIDGALGPIGGNARLAAGALDSIDGALDSINISALDSIDVALVAGSSASPLDPMREACYKMFGLAAGQLFAAGLQGFAFPWFVERQARKFRPLYFDALIHRDVGWFDTHQAAALSSEMATEIDEYIDGIGRKLPISVMAGAICVSGYSFAFLYSWKLALMVSAFLPLMALAGPIMASAIEDITQEKQGAYAKAALVVEECLFAVRTVVGFGGEQYEIDRFTAAVEEARKGGTKNRMKLGFGMGYVNSMMFAGYASTFFLAWWLRDNAEDGYEDATLSVGEVMICFSTALVGGLNFGAIIPGIMAIQASRVNLARFFHIIKDESVIERRERDDGSSLGEPARTFELRDVHFSYPARPEQKVLQGVNLSIPEGKKVALVGESGSGKSTVMALLERFYDPTSGAVLVNGKNLKSLSIASVRASVGYVGQEPVLYATTILKNIRMGCEHATDDDVIRCVKHAQMEEFVGRLPDKLDTFVGSGGSQFSGGQKQRIAIARALLKKPSVLFLDEATSALDNRSERQIQGTIDAIGRNDHLNMSIVSIAHRLSTIANSDVIFVLKAGIVVESGSHEDLISRPGGQYQALAAAQHMASEGGAGEGEPEAAYAAEDGAPSGRPSLFISEDMQEGEARGSAARANCACQEEEDAEKAREQEILKTYRVPLRRLLQFCRPEWWMIPPGVVCGVASGVPFIYALGFVLVDAWVYLWENDKAGIMETVVKFAVLGGIKWLSMTGQYSLIGSVGEAVTKRVRVAVLRSLLSQEIGFHDDPESTPAQLQTVLQLHAMRISRFFIAIGDNSDALSTIACGLALAFFRCWQLALALIVSIPILMICAMIDMAAMNGAEQSQSAAAKEAAQLVQDALTNSRTVHAGSNERELVAMYRRTVAAGDIVTKVHVIGGIGTGLSQMSTMGICGAALLLMAEFIENGTTTFQDGFGCFLAIVIAGIMAGQARMFTGDTNKATVACHDLFKLLDRESKINGLEPTGTTPPADMEGVGHLELNDVTFFYPFRPDVQVLKGVSFEIQAGTSVGVVGPSGGGKSTIFAMLQRFYDPQEGSVFVGKGVSRVDLSKVNIHWWRRQIGVVGQEPILFDGTVLDNVKYGVGLDEVVSDEHLEDCKRKCFLEFIDKSQGWSTQVGPRGSRLSGGQKQRVAICRALLRNPKVLLLDEATSALDSRSEAIVSKALERARAGRTSFAIAHRLTSIQDCDVIVVVADGKVVETGRHQQLMDKGDVYCKLYESSQKH